MAAFSQQHHPILEDSVFSPNSPLKNSGFLDEFFPNWNQFCPNSSGNPSLPLPNLEGSSIDSRNHESSCLEQQSFNDEKQGTQSLLSMADKAETESGEQVTQLCSPLYKKRKSRNGFSLNSANSKVKQAKDKKQKRDKEAKKSDKKDKKDQNKANVEEPPKGYIHVRAGRGQATDSHSLAERVRREKISERMKMLQALVPGCDKVTGKALMLDEIINYVQSLQNQVEFLSMRLASFDPMVYNFELMDLDPIMPFGNQGLINNNCTMALPLPPIQSSSTTGATATQPSNFADGNVINLAATVAAATCGVAEPPAYTFHSPHLIDSSANLFRHEQKPSVLPVQDTRSLYLGSRLDDQQQLIFFNQFGSGANHW